MSLAPLAAYAHDAVVKDGLTVRVRPIRPADAPKLLEMWHRLSSETIRMRFFALREMDERSIRYFTDLDYRDRFAFVAETGGDIVGVSRFERLAEDPTNAEFAVLVEDAHQGRGSGTVLLRALVRPAEDMGVKGFVGEVLSENSRMLRMMRDAGLAPVVTDYGSVLHTAFTSTPTERYLHAGDEQDRVAAVAALRSVFSPASVAVVGASRDFRAIGGLVFDNLRTGRFSGPVYPVNPTAPHVQTVAAYPSLSDCPTVPEMVLVCVPAPLVTDVVHEAARIGCKAAVIISAGFNEAGAEGAARERELMSVVRAHGIRVVGPNCMGVLNGNEAVRMNATFSKVFPPAGRVAFSSQSGALGLAILAAAERLGVGLSSFASVGNKADISGNDLLQYWEADDDTDVILLYLESFGNPRKFGRIARRIGRTKPIVAVKSGRTQAGERAASSHTGALAAGDVAVDALFRQAGVIRVDTLEAMFGVAAVLSNQPVPAGPRVAILTNGGGPGILAADACESNGLLVPELAQDTVDALAEFLPIEAGIRNPVDMIASIGKNSASASTVSWASWGTSRPFDSQASAARIPGPPPLVRMATRGPAGTGWFDSTAATPNIASRVSTRMTPACRNSASTATSPAARAPVWLDAARSPACVRPDFTATIGLVRPMRRAMRPNLRGLPKLSRYSRITSVSSSASQYCSRSLPEMSALLPTEAKLDRPTPRRSAAARMARPSAPDWLEKATRPAGGNTLLKVAFMRTASLPLSTPMQLGPTTRMPCARTTDMSSRSRAAPSAPASLKPAEMITAALQPMRAASCTTSVTSGAGTHTRTISGTVGQSDRLG